MAKNDGKNQPMMMQKLGRVRVSESPLATDRSGYEEIDVDEIRRDVAALTDEIAGLRAEQKMAVDLLQNITTGAEHPTITSVERPNKRPLKTTVITLIVVVSGVIGLLSGLYGLLDSEHFRSDFSKLLERAAHAVGFEQP